MNTQLSEDMATAVQSIRWALVIGLQSLCELDRLDMFCPDDAPAAQRPIHPTGSYDTHAEFADALRWVETLARGDLTEKGGAACTTNGP